MKTIKEYIEQYVASGFADAQARSFVTLFSTSEANPAEGGDPVGLDGLGEIEFWAWPDDMGYVAEDALWRIDDFNEPPFMYTRPSGFLTAGRCFKC